MDTYYLTTNAILFIFSTLYSDFFVSLKMDRNVQLEYKFLALSFTSQLSASGDSGIPDVVADPQGEVARTFQELGICVVQQRAKICQQGSLIFVL